MKMLVAERKKILKQIIKTADNDFSVYKCGISLACVAVVCPSPLSSMLAKTFGTVCLSCKENAIQVDHYTFLGNCSPTPPLKRSEC